MHERLDFVDNMRAIAIVLVVIGHSPGMGTIPLHIIYAFHMPLFFFISGLLLRTDKLALGLREYVGSLWRSLLLPYVFFTILSYLYWLITHRVATRATEYSQLAWYEPMFRLFIGYGHVANIGLWFFTCLTVTALVYFGLRKCFSEKTTLTIAVVVAFGVIFLRDPSWPRLPWGMDIAAVALLFYSTGRYVAEGIKRYLPTFPRHKLLATGLAALAASVALTFVNERVSMLEMSFGKYPALFVPNAAIGIVAVLCISAVFNAGTVSTWVSRNTIIIFPAHALMFSVFTGVGVVLFGMPHDFKDASALYGLAYAIMAMVLSYPAAWVLYRLFPFVFGNRAPIDRLHKGGRV